MALQKFRLLVGESSHSQNDPRTGANRVYSAGDVVESERDLAAEFPGKFAPYVETEGEARVRMARERRANPPAIPPAPAFRAAPAHEPPPVPADLPYGREALEDMTTAQLRALAARRGYDLGGARWKDAIVTAILEAQAGA